MSIFAKMSHFWILQKRRNHNFYRLQLLGFMKKLGNSNTQFWNEMQKTMFLGQKGTIFEFSVKSENVNFLPIFVHFPKKSENFNVWFCKKYGGGRQTDRRQRRGWIYRSEPARWASDQKQKCVHFIPVQYDNCTSSKSEQIWFLVDLEKTICIAIIQF